MTAQEEESFLNEYLVMAKSGLIVTIPMLHDQYNKSVGKIVPKSTIYRLLERHDWRKVKPDAIHPKADQIVQNKFKKKRLSYKWVRLTKQGIIEIFPFT
jgi:hypothetical protein